MNTKTVQQAFDAMVAHARKQGGACTPAGILPNGLGHSCKYRDGSGGKCFVGALIKDEHYSPDLEQNSAAHEKVRAAIKASGWPFSEGDLSFYVEMQSVHDEVPVDQWEDEFISIAEECGLEYRAPDMSGGE